MRLRIIAALGISLAVAMLVTALWGWNRAAPLAAQWQVQRPVLLFWAVRSAAIGVAAGAQVLLLSAAAQWQRPCDLASDVLRLSGLLVSMIAGVSAAALGLAGR